MDTVNNFRTGTLNNPRFINRQTPINNFQQVTSSDIGPRRQNPITDNALRRQTQQNTNRLQPNNVNQINNQLTIGPQTRPTTPPPRETPPPVQTQRVSDPFGIPLSATQRTLLEDLYVSDNRGNNNNLSFSVRDYYYGRNNKLSVGDVLLIRNQQGQIVDHKFMQPADIYDINFRENMINNIQQIGVGWGFTPDLVSLPNNELETPQNRYYWTGNGWGREKLTAQNDFWEVVERNGRRTMVQRTRDDFGGAIKASDALKHLFNNPNQYAFDCATPMPILNLKSTMDVIGEQEFNQRAGQLQFSSWFDGYDRSYFDGGFKINHVNTAQANEISINGHNNLAGEMAMFNPERGDRLVLGGAYYFDKPGDNTSAAQGWNSIYMGETAQGKHRFWAPSLGNVDVNFRPGGYVSTNDSSFKGYYLGSTDINTNIDRLQSWDRDGSGAWRY